MEPTKKTSVLNAPEVGEHAGTMRPLETYMEGAAGPSSASAPAPEKKKRAAPAKKKEKEAKECPPFEEVTLPLALQTKDVLAALCKKYGLKVTGKKDELVDRLAEYKKEHAVEGGGPAPADTPMEDVVDDRKTLNLLGGLGGKPVSKAVKSAIPKVISKLRATAVRHTIARNRFGNYEHAETKLVFDRDDQHVIGKQDYVTGNVVELADEDIEVCKQYQFSYRIPENLDSHKKGLGHVKVEEVDEELNEDDLEDDGEEDGEEDDPFQDDE